MRTKYGSGLLSNASFLLAATVDWVDAQQHDSPGRTACEAFGRSIDIGNVSLVVSSYYENNATVPLPGLVESCASRPGQNSTVVTSNLCRLVVNATTSPTSEMVIEAWLPDIWNGRFLATGNGGIGGCVDYNNLQNGVSFGFATFGTNSGHNGSTGYEFFLNEPETLNDFGYRGIHVEAEVGKQITEQYYGRAPDYNYYSGCSTGGRQGYTNAILYPDDFDGMLLASAGVDWLHIVATKALLAQRMGWPDLDSPSYVRPEQWPAIVEAQIALLDPLDGVTDGIIDDPSAHNFDAIVLTCGTGLLNSSLCLTAAQADAVNLIYAPLANGTGHIVYPSFDLGSDTSVFSANQANNSAYLSYRIVDDYWRGAVYNTTNFTSLNITTADMDIAVALNPGQIDLAGGSQPNSHDLAAYRASGGKVLALHGHADQTVTSGLAKRTFLRTAASLNISIEEAHEFYRLFYIPGHGHCAGGVADAAWAVGQPTAPGAYVDQDGVLGDKRHNALSALVAWVEEGEAPERLVGTKFRGDDFVAKEVLGQRAYCVWPEVSRWDGVGEMGVEGSWRCVLPGTSG
jgi:feruloyl esterase